MWNEVYIKQYGELFLQHGGIYYETFSISPNQGFTIWKFGDGIKLLDSIPRSILHSYEFVVGFNK